MNNVEHLLVFLLAMWVSSFVKSLLSPLMNFSVGLSASFLFICRKFLYILDKKLLTIIYVENILSTDNKPT